MPIPEHSVRLPPRIVNSEPCFTVKLTPGLALIVPVFPVQTTLSAAAPAPCAETMPATGTISAAAMRSRPNDFIPYPLCNASGCPPQRRGRHLLVDPRRVVQYFCTSREIVRGGLRV